MNRQYGFINEPKDTDFIFGTGKIPEEILQPDGDWMDYLPTKEFQAPYGFETYACVTYTILNCIEILIKRQYGIEKNYSDRFLAIVSNTKNPGNSPQVVCDFLRKIGLVPEELWPYNNSINSWEKWSKPIPAKLYELAKEFNIEWDFRYEQVMSNPNSITKALTMSPLFVSVSAWYPKGDKFYRPQGMNDNHATTMFYQRAGDFRRVFDSYDSPHIKDVEWDDVPQFVQRYWIKKREDVEKQISLMQKILQLLTKWLNLIDIPTTEPLPPQLEPVLPQPELILEPRPSVADFAQAIQVFEGFYPPSAEHPHGSVSWRNNNPGNLKGMDGKFIRYATYNKGFFTLCDYIKRVGRGEHKAYPKNCDIKQFFLTYAPASDSNYPISYGVWVAHRIGVATDFKINALT